MGEGRSIATRRDLLAHVRAHPGSHLRELERGSGLAVGALRHHLDYLLSAGLITEQMDGRLRRFFPVGLDAELRRAIASLRPRSHRAVILRLLNHPDASTQDLAAALALPLSTAQHYLRALERAGVLERSPPPATWRLRDEDAIVRALVAYRPSFGDRLVDAALELWFES